MPDATPRGTGGHPEIEAAAWAILGPGLRCDPSPIDPSVRSWSAHTARDIISRVQNNPDEGSGSFLEKLHGQLDGADRATILLAAELLYLQCGPLSRSPKPATKRNRVNTVLSWATPPLTLPEQLDAALDAQAFHGGQGFSSALWYQLNWLCRFVETWFGLPGEQQQAALADPWEFGRIARLTPGGGGVGIRYALEYLAWPGFYEHIVTKEHKIAIRDAFVYEIDRSSGDDESSIDQDLHKIRGSIQARTGTSVDWYQSPYVEQWHPNSAAAQRAWLVRPTKDGGSQLADRWVSEGFVSLAATFLGPIDNLGTPSRVREAVDAGYESADYQRRDELTNDYHAFLNKMKPEDLVVTRVGDLTRIGTILGEPELFGEQGSRLRRAVQWMAYAVPASELTPPLPSLLEQQGSVVDLTDALDIIAALAARNDGEPDDLEPPEPEPPVVVEPPRFRPVEDALIRRTHLDREALQEILDLLEARRQIVLYGPPGTGKTYLARAIADHIVGVEDPSRRRLVQFHPSYAYEDFFEGFRPEPDRGTFTLQAGPMRQLASRAGSPENAGDAYVLIIDEMNRANLAKVFGELYFLLEYRGEAVQPQYSPDKPFRLPPNLFIIGTMNTSDRSIALVDAAIRRRFAFVELHPDQPPTHGVLGRYLAANHRDDLPERLLTELNSRIDETDRDMRIGPSYLMKPEADTPAGLARIWRYDIMPLLEEYYYGRLTRTEVQRRFGLESIHDVVAAQTDSANTLVGEQPDDDDENPM